MIRLSYCIGAFLLLLVLKVPAQAQDSPETSEIEFTAADMPKKILWFGGSRDEGPNSVFSPDTNWIVTSNGGASRGVELELYHREKGFHYKRVNDFKLGDQAEAIVLKEPGVPIDTRLDHRYISFMLWSSDSKAFMFMMGGHDSGKNLYIPNGWFGIYDLATRKITFDSTKFHFDLPKSNQTAVAERPKRRE